MRAYGLILILALFAVACSAASNESDGSGGGSSGGGSGSGSGGGGGIIQTGGTGGGGGVIETGGTGGGGGSGNSCAGVSQKADNTVLPADVIWTIDTSCSMVEETAAVRANMSAFSKQISNAGIDIRIVLIAEQYKPPPFPGFPDDGICIDAPLGSGFCPGDTNPVAYNHLYQTVASTNSLQLILSTYPTWKTVLRPNSLKIFTVVTDDNSALPAKDFTDGVNALDPVVIKPNSWKVYGIYCFNDCPSAASPGTVYQTLVQQTGGVAGDLCLQNFKPVFDKLAAGIVGSAKLDCAWTIPPPPAGETFNKTKVNVIYTPGGGAPQPPIGKVANKAACGAQGGWYYDDENNPSSVLLCDNTCQAIQSDPSGQIDIQFGCDTVQVPR